MHMLKTPLTFRACLYGAGRHVDMTCCFGFFYDLLLTEARQKEMYLLYTMKRKPKRKTYHLRLDFLRISSLRILHVAKEHLSSQCILSGLCKQPLLLEKTETKKKICPWYHRLSHPCLCTLLSHGERSITARIGSTKHIIAELPRANGAWRSPIAKINW